MPFGDSITADTCYPQLLSQEFKSKGHTNFQFVGTNLNDQSCNGAPNVQTEGHGGYLVTFLTTNTPSRTGLGTLSQLQTWAAEKPDLVLMHYGTNDVWSNVATADIMSAYLFVINQFRGQNPNVIFFVSKIISMNPAGCSTCAAGVTALDAAITDAWASTNSTATSPIFIVDQSNAVDTSTQTVDGVHPNIAGATNMADNAYTAVSAQNYF
jgi:lysophospholipase L1-like esterase